MGIAIGHVGIGMASVLMGVSCVQGASAMCGSVRERASIAMTEMTASNVVSESRTAAAATLILAGAFTDHADSDGYTVRCSMEDMEMVVVCAQAGREKSEMRCETESRLRVVKPVIREYKVAHPAISVHDCIRMMDSCIMYSDPFYVLYENDFLAREWKRVQDELMLEYGIAQWYNLPQDVAYIIIEYVFCRQRGDLEREAELKKSMLAHLDAEMRKRVRDRRVSQRVIRSLRTRPVKQQDDCSPCATM